MVYIYFDESGNLGFSHNSTKCFVVSFLICNNEKILDRIVKRTFATLSRHGIKKHSGVLHAYNELSITKKRLLKLLVKNQKNVSIVNIKLNKQNVNEKLKNDKHALYNYVVKILIDRLYKNCKFKNSIPITFIASRRETKTNYNNNFKSYIFSEFMGQQTIPKPDNIKVEIKSPSQCKGLQVVDFIAWSILRKYETGDSLYYNILKPIIKYDDELFKS
jgi:hypothetical protein